MTTIETPTTSATTGLIRGAALPAHLASYAGIHDAMVRDAARLARVVATVAADEGPALVSWWEHYEANIVHHHEREDDLVFPLVARVDPAFRADELVADHVVLDTHMDQLRAGLAALAAGTRDLDDHRAELTGLVATFAAHLDDHLAREEQVIFPVLATRVSADEYADLEAQMRKGSSLRDLAFTLPWILDDVDPDLEAKAEVPWLLAALDRLFWQRRYRRIAAPVLARR